MARIAGDSLRAGHLYVIRYKSAHGYATPVHWHSQDELFKVLKGTLGLGFGRRFDRKKAILLKPGCYGWVPSRRLHYTWTDGPIVLEIQGIGPFETFHADEAGPRSHPPKRLNRAR